MSLQSPFIDVIAPFKTADLTGFVPVLVHGQPVGYTKPDFAKKISDFDQTWELTDHGLELSDKFETFDARTEAVDNTFVALSEAGHLPVMPDYSAFGGIDWYPVRYRQNAVPLFKVKRFYAFYLGIQFNSVFLNGYHDGQYWLARRSEFVHEHPGMLDVIVGGSTRYGESVMETLTHEAYEESSLSADDVKRAIPSGSLYLKYLTDDGFLRHEHFHLFDIDMKDQVPKVKLPVEVEGFDLIWFKELFELVAEGKEIKPQVNLIMTDFMIRHNILTEETPHYKEICELLYRPTEE